MAKTKTAVTELAIPATGKLGGNDVPNKSGVYRVNLKKGETAWHPGSTKYEFFGQGWIEYTVYSDGGVSFDFECGQRPIPGTAG